MNAIERGWYHSAWWCWLLWPLSGLFWLITAVRRFAYRRGWLKSIALPVPVVVVGNISVGGTGKTPFTLWLCRWLQQQGHRPGIISRGYGARITQPTLVDPSDSAAAVGDEPLLLAQRSGCPVVVCPDRVAAGQYLLSQHDCTIIISDDGLQHYRLQRSLEIVLIDGFRGLGNGLLLPAGPLREPVSRLKQADLVIANSKAHSQAHGCMQLKIVSATGLLEQDILPVGPVHLLAAIGNPERFAHTAEEAGFSIVQRFFYGDHHAYTEQELSLLPTPLLMTEKDAVKCRAFARPGWYQLAVEACPDTEIEQQLATLMADLRS
ncbi:tetraacyldisaccharide 4'-kinase [Alkalimonas collagenimarina]|uniref:Tetraacyldisaccharide 4'-kinase n=1 Tax=Alkalimonas collagenimarina TaxID=400390 RepID=A0ABT9H209_9GAMM|nr:tetraacyldisaccharide 4'-kinase [Alkalimonas collagenimarina]MDP4536935.1 tetraacyldisaccharide 4'-kinase [Alkalimonas collagenimarina]